MGPPPDPLSDEALAKFAAEVIPEVEAIAGRTFTTRPGVKWIKPDTLSALIADETRRVFTTLYPGVHSDFVEAQAQRAEGQLGGLLGKFTLETQEVHLAKEPLRDHFVTASDAEGTGVQAIKLVLAHELAHALQNQRSSVNDQLWTCADEDAFQAWRGVSEGFATWVEGEYARQHGWEDMFDRLTQAQGWNKQGLANPHAFPIWASYGLGRDAISAWVGAHGREWLWTDLFEAIPRDTAMLFRPETYSPGDHPADPALLRALDGVEVILSKDALWNVIPTRTGEYYLRESAAFADPGLLDRSLATLDAAAQREAFAEDRQLLMRLLRFDDAANADHYVKVLAAMDLGAAKDASAQIGVPIEVELQPISGFPEGTAWRRVRRVTGGGGLQGEVEFSWAVQGRFVATIEAHGFRPGLRGPKALGELLGRATAPPGG